MPNPFRWPDLAGDIVQPPYTMVWYTTSKATLGGFFPFQDILICRSFA